MTPHGVNDATTDHQQIDKWWTEHPDANIGIAAGQGSGILVLDIDPRNGGTETLKRLEKELGQLPDTVTSNTGGGGQHRIFAHPAFPVRKDNSGKLLGSGIDVLSDFCIMVAPPSRHASGIRYGWQGGKSFRDLEPVPLPEPWLERMRGNTPARPDADSALAQPAGLVPEGQRNNHLTSLAGTLQRSGASPEAIKAALRAENVAKFATPLDSSEVEKIVASVSKYPSAAFSERGDAAEKLLQVLLDRQFAGGKLLTFGTDGQFWHYSGKLWQPVPDKWIDGRILETLRTSPVQTSATSASLLRQARTLLEAKLAIKEDLFAFTAEPPPVINCANGELWMAPDGKVELRSHKPESCLRHCLDVTFDPEAKSPEYDRALDGIFSAALNPKGLRRHWNELFGYIIQPRRNIPLIGILLGSGDNGKTKLTETMMKLLGKNLVQCQRVDELDKSRFGKGSLFGKYLFLDDDVRAGVRLPDGTLKTISEAKEVTGEHKYGPAFNFTVRTVPLLLCNNIPSLADVSYGMLRRLMVIPFDRRFTNEDRDPDLFERIWANELSGVLNRALKGYGRLLERGRLRYPSAVRTATEHWLQQANPLPAFLQERCVRKPEARSWIQEVHTAYRAWAERAGYTLVQNQLTFRRNLEHLGLQVSHGNRGQRVHGLALRA
jgi:putative DNA primase/helicase